MSSSSYGSCGGGAGSLEDAGAGQLGGLGGGEVLMSLSCMVVRSGTTFARLSATALRMFSE